MITGDDECCTLMSYYHYIVRVCSATSTFARTSTPTQFFLVAPRCSPALLSEWPRKSLPWPRPQWRSRWLLPQNANIQSGSAALYWPRCPPSNKCGSQSRNTTRPAQPSYIASASERMFVYHDCFIILFNIYMCLLKNYDSSFRKYWNIILTLIFFNLLFKISFN